MSAAPDAIIIRRFQPAYAADTVKLFYRAVHLGTVGHYNEEQRHAWAKSIPETESWCTRLQSQTNFVAEISGVISGFMTVNANGFIDLAFVAPEHMNQGIGKSLYQAIENWALDKAVTQIDSRKPFR